MFHISARWFVFNSSEENNTNSTISILQHITNNHHMRSAKSKINPLLGVKARIPISLHTSPMLRINCPSPKVLLHVVLTPTPNIPLGIFKWQKTTSACWNLLMSGKNTVNFHTAHLEDFISHCSRFQGIPSIAREI